MSASDDIGERRQRSPCCSLLLPPSPHPHLLYNHPRPYHHSNHHRPINGRRPGILVLINGCDWELSGALDAELAPGDAVAFISTLHGG